MNNTNTSQHTSGPWQNCLGSFGPYVVAQTIGKDKVIAKLHYSMTPDVESEEENAANCRLIAAAPDLLAALQCVVAALSQPVQTTDLTNADASRLAGVVQILRGDATMAINTARAAIARATQQS